MNNRIPVSGHRRRCQEAGLTLVEIIAAFFIIAIIASGAFIFFDTEEYTVYGERQALETALRFTQTMAMSDTVPWGLAINNATYQLQRNCTVQAEPTTRVFIPGTGSDTYRTEGPIKFSTETVVFSPRGQPIDNCAGLNALGADLTVEVEIEGGIKAPDIVITRNTGLIQ